MTQQVETATVVGTIGPAGAGNATVIVTSAYMSNSPKTFNVAVANDDTASQVAEKIRVALVYSADVAAQFLVSGSGTEVKLTAHVSRANDSTLNISIANGTCSGLTSAPTSANTTAGDGLTNSYATLAEYKAWIAVRGLSGAVGTDVSDDDAIETLLEGASRYIDRQTGRRFYADANDVTRYYTATDAYCVKVHDLSAAPTTVAVDYNFTRSYTTLATTTYDLLPDNAITDGFAYNRIELIPSTVTNLFPAWRNAVQVVGKFGYPSIPADIKEACLMIAQNTYATRSGQSASGRITVTAAGVVIRPEEVPSMAQKIMEYYREYL
jgi:hypothetical protein